jgi:hypothetical protein
MKTLLISLIVFAACAAYAQQPCLKLAKIKIEKQLRQSSATEVKLKFETKGCYIVTESESLGKQPPTLDVQEIPDGITAKVETVAAPQILQSAMDREVLKAQVVSTTILLNASSQAELGDSKLSGTLHYMTVDKAGTIKPESLAFSFPFQVALPLLPQQENSSVDEMKRAGELIAAVVLFPITLLIFLIYCPISGNCGDC